MDRPLPTGQLATTYQKVGTLGLFTLRGLRDLESSLLFWRQASRVVREENLTAVLIQDQAEDRLLAHEVIEVELALNNSGLPRRLPVAIVDEDATDTGNNAFGELVARNRGWPMIRLFRREVDANNWLQIPPVGEEGAHHLTDGVAR